MLKAEEARKTSKENHKIEPRIERILNYILTKVKEAAEAGKYHVDIPVERSKQHNRIYDTHHYSYTFPTGVEVEGGNGLTEILTPLLRELRELGYETKGGHNNNMLISWDKEDIK